jgi:hypothetical protein
LQVRANKKKEIAVAFRFKEVSELKSTCCISEGQLGISFVVKLSPKHYQIWKTVNTGLPGKDGKMESDGF